MSLVKDWEDYSFADGAEEESRRLAVAISNMVRGGVRVYGPDGEVLHKIAYRPAPEPLDVVVEDRDRLRRELDGLRERTLPSRKHDRHQEERIFRLENEVGTLLAENLALEETRVDLQTELQALREGKA